MPFNKKILALVVATTAAMAVGTNVHMELNENNNNSQNKELKVNNEKLLVGSNNEENSNAINDSDTIVMAGNGKAYTDLQNIKFNLNGVPVSGKTITVTDNSGNFIGGGILSNGVVPVSQLSEGQTTLGRKNIIIKVQGCKEPIVIKNKMIGMLNYEVTKVSGLKPGETYTINSYPAAQNQTVTANSNGDVFIKRDNSYSYINLCKDGKVVKSLPGMGPISGDNEEYTIPSLKSIQTTILPYFVIGKGDIIINLGTVNRIFVNSDEKVIKKDTFTGEVGTSIQKADIPKGYEVKSVTVEENGKVISGKLDPTSIGNSKITVIYHLEKKKQYGNAAIKVIDSVTKQPLGNAKVTYNGKTYTTNAKGEVTISGITPGDITVNGSDNNYHNGSTKVEVTPNGQGTGIISLTPDNGTMKITVVDSETKKPLENAKVTYDGKTYTTDRNGEVTISNLKPGDVKATASDEGYTNGQTSVKLDPNGKVTGTISLNPEAGKVVVTVNGENGPLKNTKVIVNGTPETTNGEGQVTVKTSEGKNTITIGTKNYHNGTVTVDGKPDGTEKANVTLTPDNGTVTIKVVDSKTGKVLSGATVNINGQILHTNSNGEVQVSNVKPGDVKATASDKGYTNGQTSVNLDPNGKATGIISLNPEVGKVVVTVNGENGPLKNTKVTVNGTPETTNGEGQVTVKTSEGKNTITIGTKNYHNGTVTVDGKPGGTEKANVTLTPDNGTMKITVVDSETKKPLENAKVTYDGKTYITNAKGEVTISNVIPGNVTVNGSDNNYHSGSTKVKVIPNGQGTGIISLTPDNGTVTIKVVDSKTGKVLSGATVNINGQTLHTNSKGEVQVSNAKPGNISATASDEGYTNGQTSVNLDPNGKATGTISLNPEAGKVVVTVNGENGPLRNTKVIVNGTPETTNGEGQVTVKTSEGKNTITIGSKNYHDGTVIVDGKPGGTDKTNVTLTPDNGTMKITVVDSETKKPLENAKVTYDGKTYTTDRNGEVTISNVTPGDVTVNGSDDNYHNGSTKVEVTPNGQETGTISLIPDNGIMKITVVDSETKKPLENAKVTYDGKTYTTNVKGEVTISNVTPGDVTVDGSDNNYHNGSTKVEVTPNGQETGIISLTPDNGTVTIKVVDSKTGKVLSGATVNINGQTLHTNSNGEVEVSNVKPGNISATASDKGYTNGQTSVKLDPNGKATGTISLNPEAGKVVVAVNGENGPLKNTKVTVNGTPETTNGEGQVTVKTSEGKNTITIGSENYHNGTVTVDGKPGGTEKANVTLTPDNGTMKITVIDSETKKPLENAKVTYDGKTYTTNGKGEVTISNVTPGDVTVDGSDDNYHSGSTKVEVTPNGQGTGVISLTPDNGTVTIKVVDSKTGKALSGATVNINGQTLHTNSNGEVQVSNVKPGNISATASDTGYTNGQTSVNLDPNGKVTGTISLNPEAGKVVVTVNGENGPLKNTKVTVNGTPETTNGEGQVTVKTSEGKNTITIGSENYHDGTVTVDGKPGETGKTNITLTPDNGTMKIIVVDSETKKPLENAKVTYDGKTYTTDRNGEVTISNVKPGDVKATASDEGYTNGQTSVKLDPNGKVTGTISLNPEAGKVVVTVNGENGPLKNTKVIVNGTPETTNGEGQVTIKTSEGKNTITIGTKNYHNGTVTVDGKPDGTEKANVTLTPDNGTVTIKVVDSKTGKVLSGATVNINGQTLHTNSNGEVQVSNVKPGNISATASDEGYTNGQTSVKLDPNGKATGTISLNPEAGKVVVTVNGENGPLKNTKVIVNGTPETTNGEGQVTVKTSEGKNTITIGSKNYHDGTVIVDGKPGGTDKTNVTLTPDNGTMKITVVDSETKKPLQNATVTYGGKTYTTDRNGEVTISNVTPGDVIVDGSDNNYHNGSTKVEVTPNRQGTGVISLTPDNGTMKITVVDSETKKPLENAKVTYDGKTYTTDRNGEVTISNVKPGDVTVDGSDDNYQNGSTKVEVTPNGQETGTISLTPDNGTVTIKVVDSKTGKVLSGATVNINGQTLHTNSNGEVQVSNVKPGNISATASDEGYTNGQTSVNLDPNGKAFGIISLNPEVGKVVITVNNDKGPLRNKIIIVNGKEEKTNDNGEVTVGTTVGTNHIKISLNGYNDKNIDVNTTIGSTKYKTVTLTPKMPSVRINIIGKDGNIISSKIVNENSPQLDIPKGYKIYSITVNGEKVNGNNLTKSDLENKDVAINVVNDKNLPNTGINGEVIFNIEELVTVASIIGMLGLGEIFRRKNRR